MDHTTSSSVNCTHSPHTVESSQGIATTCLENIQCASLLYLQDSNHSNHNPFNHHQAAIAGDNNKVTGDRSVIIAGSDNNSAGGSSAIIAGEDNEIAGHKSAIVGGMRKTNSAWYSAVM